MTDLVKFKQGLGFLYIGYRAIFQGKGLLKWALIPFLIDIVLFVWGITWGANNLSTFSEAALGFIFSEPSGFFYTLFYYPLYLLFWAAFVVVLVFGIYIVASVVASPFNSVLAEKTLISRGVIKDRPFQLVPWLKMTARMTGVSIIRAVLFGIVGLFLFLMAFVPGLNLLAAFLGFLIMAFDSTDYSMEILEQSLGERVGLLKKNKIEYSGMACVMGTTILVPGLTLLVMPLAVVGGAHALADMVSIQK